MEYMWVNLWNGKLSSYGRGWDKGEYSSNFNTEIADLELQLNIKAQLKGSANQYYEN